MNFSSIEWIAFILIVGAIIKMFVLWINPKAWFDFANGFYKNVVIAQIIGMVLATIIFYYLIQGGVTIVQILAIMAFLAMILVVGLASELDILVKRYKSLIRSGKLWKKYWLYILIWIILLVLGAKELFNL